MKKKKQYQCTLNVSFELLMEIESIEELRLVESQLQDFITKKAGPKDSIR